MDFGWKPANSQTQQTQTNQSNTNSIANVKIDDSATKVADNAPTSAPVKPLETPVVTKAGDDMTIKNDSFSEPKTEEKNDFLLTNKDSGFDDDFVIQGVDSNDDLPKIETPKIDAPEELRTTEFEDKEEPAEKEEKPEEIKTDSTLEPVAEIVKPEEPSFKPLSTGGSKSLDEIEKQISEQREKLTKEIEGLNDKMTKLNEVFGKIKSLRSQEAELLSQASAIIN